MFIGHYGVGLGAKKFAPGISLGTLFLASQFIDLLWPLFILFGLERVEIDPGNTAFTPLHFVYYPYTHSFVGVLGWAVGFGLVYYLFRKHFRRAALLGGLVISHWLLDLIVHAPDLQLLPWSETRIGLGLWNSIPLSIGLESMIFLFGAFLYMRVTRPRDRIGSMGLYGLLIFLSGMYILNVFGPPPDAVEPIGWVGLSQWLMIAWAYWIDRHRTSVVPSSSG